MIMYDNMTVYKGRLRIMKRSLTTVAGTALSTLYLSPLIHTFSNLPSNLIYKSQFLSVSSMSNFDDYDGASMKESESSFSTVRSPPHFIHHFSVESTQDEAKKYLRNVSTSPIDDNRVFAISTSIQTKGRGTSGRKWIGCSGNTFITIGIPSDLIKFPISLLPLWTGTVLSKCIFETLQENQNDGDEHLNTTNNNHFKVTVKWPNDVLVNDKKVAGILIESDCDNNGSYWYLVGIGVNYCFAPDIDVRGPERGRTSTCLLHYMSSNNIYSTKKSSDSHTDCDDDFTLNESECLEGAKKLAFQITNDLARELSDMSGLLSSYIGGTSSNEALSEHIIHNWERWCEYGKPQILRDTPTNEVVVPLGLETDGRLIVRVSDGSTRTLCIDYLL